MVRRKRLAGCHRSAGFCRLRRKGRSQQRSSVTSVAVYTGSSPLPKPQKILVYDFAVNADDVQVDKVQALRPRHLITGDKSRIK